MSPKIIRIAGFSSIFLAIVIATLIFSGVISTNKSWVPVLLIFARFLIYFLPAKENS